MHHRCDRNGGMYMKYILGQMRAKAYYEKVECVKKWVAANKAAMDKEDEERKKWFAEVLKKATDAEADALKILNSGGPPPEPEAPPLEPVESMWIPVERDGKPTYWYHKDTKPSSVTQTACS